jgi:hypothetical protein
MSLCVSEHPFLLALASTVIVGSESHGTHYHASLSDASGNLHNPKPPFNDGVSSKCPQHAQNRTTTAGTA